MLYPKKFFHQNQLDTTTPMGKLMFAVSAAYWEYDREMNSARINAGLDRARKQGKRLGRPTVPPIKIHQVEELRGQGVSYKKIAKRTGVSVGKVHQIINA